MNLNFRPAYISGANRLLATFLLWISCLQVQAVSTISGRDPLIDDGDGDAWSAITVLTTPITVPPAGSTSGTITRFRYWADSSRTNGFRSVRPLLLERVNGSYQVIGIGTRSRPTSGGLKDVSFGLLSGTDSIDLTRPGVTYHPGILQLAFGQDDVSAGLVPFGSSGGAGVILDNVPGPNYTATVGQTVSSDFSSGPGGRHYSFHFETEFDESPVPPTDLLLENVGVFTGMPGGSLIASILTIDGSSNDTHTYSLPVNPGGVFEIAGNELRLADGIVVDQSSYTFTIQVTDSTSNVYQEEFTLAVAPASPPTDLLLSASAISSSLGAGGLVGFLSSVDVSVNDVHAYALVSGAGSDNNGLFTIAGEQLTLASALPVSNDPLKIRVRSTDLSGLSVTKEFQLPIIQARLRITEFLSSNDSGLQDEDGDFSDWVELFNEKDTAISLGGYFLTDDPQDPRKWVLPDMQLAPGAYLIVFASGKDRRVVGSELHTDFELSADGGYLALTEPDGFTVVDQFTPDQQLTDLSFGSGAGAGTPGFLTPTPGMANGPSFVAGLSEVTFSQERGFYNTAFQLTLTSFPAGAQIYYTLDGSAPADGVGNLYTGPVTVTGQTGGTQQGSRIVRAIAVNSGAAIEPVATHSYLFVNGIVGQSNFENSITGNPTYGPLLDNALLAQPAVSIVGGFPGSIEEETSIEFFTPDGAEPGFQIDCGVKTVGGGSLASPKNNFRLYFRSQYGASKLRYPLFQNHPFSEGAVEVFDRLNLRGGAHDTFFWLADPRTPANSGGPQRGDAQYIRNRWMNDMQLQMGQPAPHGRWVHVYLNGSYHGQYQFMEWPNNDFLGSYLPGSGDDFEYTNSANPSKNGSDNWQATWASIEAAAATSYDEAARWIDVENFADYMVLCFYGGNPWDWLPNQNWMAGGGAVPDSPKGKWKFFAWDSDIVLQDPNANVLDAGVPDGLFDTMMAHEEFRIVFRDRIYRHCFHEGVLTPSRVGIAHALRADEIRTSLIAETARWQGNAINPPWDRDDEWQNELDRTADFFQVRTGILMDQFRNESNWYPLEAPEFDLRGGIVEVGHLPILTADEGTIYYTTDGSDPRLSGGGFAPGAMVLGGNPVVSLVEQGASWKYLADGTNQGTTWRNLGFDDSSWPSGNAELGYGEGDEATDVGYVDISAAAGEQRNITTYYRHVFNLADASRVIGLAGLLKRDDGAVVYLNGQELTRENLPNGAINYLTPASPAADDGNDFHPFAQSNGGFTLNDGLNVIAVEIHQSSNTSSDTSFDFSLSAEVASEDDGLIVNKASVIRTRAFDGTTWSPLNEANFTVTGTLTTAAENLLLSEIHYNPQFTDETEFLEFQNIAAAPLDLSGATISGAITFTFPAGTVLLPNEYVLVVEDEAVFRARYASPSSSWFVPDLKVAGEWTGALSNGGETISINNASGAELYSVPYSDDGSWPGRADGKGSSVELAELVSRPTTQPELDAYLASGNRWRPSSEFHGSPGRAGGGPDNRVVFNEVLANTNLPAVDSVELLSRASEPVAMGGWFMSDDSDFYQKFSIPAGTTLDAEGLLLFDEGDFNSDNAIPFALSASKGDDLYLLEANAAGDLVRFVDRVEFGASATGESFGRWPDGEGSLYPMISTTLGMLNNSDGNYVRTGPIVVSEIHYNPDGPDDGFEFIRITNTGMSDQLMDQWRLRGEVDFDFPSGLLLEVDESLILVDFDPALTSAANAFRSEYGLMPTAVLLGPWNDSGVIPTKLSDGGGAIRLQRPDTLVTPLEPDTPSFYPMLFEDTVNYRDSAPWPVAADGSGSSLLRNFNFVYGDEPTNWRALSNPLMPGDGGFNYSVWAETAFAPGTSSADRLANADPDGDGINNFGEFAFLLDPSSRTAISPLRIVREADGASLLLTYRQRTNVSGIQYALKGSPDLFSWDIDLNDVQMVSTVLLPNGQGVETTVRYSLPSPQGGRLFIRVETSQ